MPCNSEWKKMSCQRNRLIFFDWVRLNFHWNNQGFCFAGIRQAYIFVFLHRCYPVLGLLHPFPYSFLSFPRYDEVIRICYHEWIRIELIFSDVSSLFSRLDYCGIAILIVGSVIPWLYYGFYCQVCIYFISPQHSLYHNILIPVLHQTYLHDRCRSVGSDYNGSCHVGQIWQTRI